MGALPKELSRQHILVLRIQDVYPESQIPDPTFFHPGSRIRPVSIPDPGSRIRIKEFKYFNPKKTKKWFLSSRKYDPSCSSRIPDPDADFLPIPDPGSRGQKGTGSRIPANHPPPPEYLLTQDSCKETSPPLLHTTTHNNSTRIHKTTNVPVVFMARYVMILTFLGLNSTCFARAISGPKKVSIFRAHPFQCPS